MDDKATRLAQNYRTALAIILAVVEGSLEAGAELFASLSQDELEHVASALATQSASYLVSLMEDEPIAASIYLRQQLVELAAAPRN